MILLWGLLGDDPLASVYAALVRRGLPVAFVDQRAARDTHIELVSGDRLGGRLQVGTLTVNLDSITAAYIRPHDSRRLAGVEEAGPGSHAWQHALDVEDCLLSWSELTTALVVNRPDAMAGNGSKPYQGAQIRSVGFASPETLITTDPTAARAFWENQERGVIYKSISGIRSIVSRLTADHLVRLDDVAWCPTQFQRFIPGNDYRVHVIGDDVFACEIVSDADDYRYASGGGAAVEIRPYVLPAACADRCRELATMTGLVVAGLDLRRGTEGEWYCFEVNPSPGFTFYQEATGQPIDEAIASLLAASTARPSERPRADDGDRPQDSHVRDSQPVP